MPVKRTNSVGLRGKAPERHSSLATRVYSASNKKPGERGRRKVNGRMTEVQGVQRGDKSEEHVLSVRKYPTFVILFICLC